MEAKPPEPASAGAPASRLPHGWVPIGERQWSIVWVGASSLVGTLIIYQTLFFITQVGRLLELPLPVVAIVAVGVVTTVLVVMTLVHRWRWPQPAVNLDTSELRSGTKVVPLAAITTASLAVVSVRKTRVLVLRVTADKEARAEFVLRNRNNHTPDAETLGVLSEALRRTSIAMPVSKDDPDGRFARYNFPGFLTREQAVALVLDPPESDEPLPILIA